jgi:hypothetical protein
MEWTEPPGALIDAVARQVPEDQSLLSASYNVSVKVAERELIQFERE